MRLIGALLTGALMWLIYFLFAAPWTLLADATNMSPTDKAGFVVICGPFLTLGVVWLAFRLWILNTENVQRKAEGHPGILYEYRLLPAATFMSLNLSGILTCALATYGAHPDNYGRLAESDYLALLVAATCVSAVLAWMVVRTFRERPRLAAALSAVACGAVTSSVASLIAGSDLVGTWLVCSAVPLGLLWFLMVADADYERAVKEGRYPSRTQRSG